MAVGVGTLQRSRLKWSPVSDRSEPGSVVPFARKHRDVEKHAIQDLPDLLHPEPRFVIDQEALSAQLAFAFAGGDASDNIRRVLAGVETAPSEWRPESFARHLFVDEFIKTVCRADLDGHFVEMDAAFLSALLTRPPVDTTIRDFRRDILAELVENSEARTGLTELYKRLRELRSRFLLAAPQKRMDTTRHRLELLGTIRAAIDQAASGFPGRSSGLARVGLFGKTLVESEAYARLRDLLEHDRQRASVALDLRIGGDGRVRGVQIRNLIEATDNRYYLNPFQRFAKKVSLWIRGLGFAEEALIDYWIDGVYAGLEQWLPALFQLLGQLEFYLAALAFRDASKKRGLEVCLPDLSDRQECELRSLFNPLLFAQNVTPVPCDLVRSGAGTTTVITGPNSGGKTRVMQAIGLSQLLAQVGFFVPAASAKLRPVPLVFCSLVQEDSFDQSEGRLGTELLRIRRLFEEARPGSLVVLDELCSGTNPSEGEEIFMLVISLLHELQPETFVTSHFLDFVGRLAKTEDSRLRFLQVELDEKEQPTYAFVPGVAKTSLATRAAQRLGVTREELLALVHKNR
jgi:DNA mismatch repair protein MutS2